jgi:replication factor C subunit 3/5
MSSTALWADEFRPKTLDKMDIHKSLSKQLISTVKSGDFPHMLFYGPSGAGKKTRVNALLRQVFGNKADKLKLENKDLKVGSSGSKTITVTVLTSPCHIEVNPSDYGVYDRYVVSQLIKEIASSAPIVLDQQQQKEQSIQQQQFKVVVLTEIDQLTKEAQQALRRTMEKYMKTCRLVMTAESISKVIAPVKSRSLCTRISTPTSDEIVSVLQSTASKANIVLPNAFAESIAEVSDGNLRKALLSLESSKVEQYPFTKDQIVKITDWERFVRDIAKDLIEDQSPSRILELREKYYMLLSNGISPASIMKKLTHRLLDLCGGNPQIQFQIVHLAALYEHRVVTGSKAIFHLETFSVRFMSIYKQYLLKQVL